MHELLCSFYYFNLLSWSDFSDQVYKICVPHRLQAWKQSLKEVRQSTSLSEHLNYTVLKGYYWFLLSSDDKTKSNRLLKSACGCFWPWSAQLRKHLFCFICLECKDTQPEALYSSFRIFTLMYWRCFAKYNLRMLGNTSRYQIRYQIAWWVMQNINLLFVKSAPENKH